MKTIEVIQNVIRAYASEEIVMDNVDASKPQLPRIPDQLLLSLNIMVPRFVMYPALRMLERCAVIQFTSCVSPYNMNYASDIGFIGQMTEPYDIHSKKLMDLRDQNLISIDALIQDLRLSPLAWPRLDGVLCTCSKNVSTAIVCSSLSHCTTLHQITIPNHILTFCVCSALIRFLFCLQESHLV
jgi:hypothetical protein